MFLQETYTMIELILSPKYLWAIASLMALVFLIVTIIRLHRSDSKVNLIELLFIDQTTGKQSDSKVRLNTAFILSAWAFVYLVMNDKFTDWYFFGFMGAWVTDRFLARYSNSKNDAMNLSQNNYLNNQDELAFSRYQQEQRENQLLSRNSFKNNGTFS